MLKDTFDLLFQLQGVVLPKKFKISCLCSAVQQFQGYFQVLSLSWRGGDEVLKIEINNKLTCRILKKVVDELPVTGKVGKLKVSLKLKKVIVSQSNVNQITLMLTLQFGENYGFGQ